MVTRGKLIITAVLIKALASGCSEGSFSGESGRIAPGKNTPSTTPAPQTNTPNDAIPTPDDNTTIKTDDGGAIFQPCTRELQVPGRSNPFLAGMPEGTSINYTFAKKPDVAGSESPVQLVPDRPDCIKEGQTIVFNISGQISHGGSPATDADGKQDDIKFHQKNAFLGKSNIRAPLNSMVGVFLTNDIPSGTPPTMDFQSPASRDYVTISPAVGQIFFIGDGKRSNGELQEVVVPAGAKRVFIGIMDAYEWSNNSGALSGGFSIKKK